MPSLPEITLLGIIQGFTEWLPVSSSGHLVLVQELLHIDQPLMLDIALHVGSLVVILLFLRREIMSILSAVWRRDFASEPGKLAIYIAVGTVPVALAVCALFPYQSPWPWVRHISKPDRPAGNSTSLPALCRASRSSPCSLRPGR